MEKNNFYSLTHKKLNLILESENINLKTADNLFNWYYKKKNTEECTHNISKMAQNFIRNTFSFKLPEIVYINESKDRTVKFLFELADGHRVETVLIAFANKYSICLSSQVGCLMKCSFCFTGEQGLKRNLETSEIIGQYLQVWQWLKKNRPDEAFIPTIVFMGQGEPLHNYDALSDTCEILLSKYGLSIGHQRITISTSGYLPGLSKWAKNPLNVNLALSLHSPFTEKRNQLIPINKKYPLNEVLLEIEKIPLLKKQFVIYEYLLIKDLNDQVLDAHATGKLLAGKPAYINLIPFNPYPSSRYERPSDDTVKKFKDILDTYKIPTLIRGTKGDDVLAACGQLNTKKN